MWLEAQVYKPWGLPLKLPEKDHITCHLIFVRVTSRENALTTPRPDLLPYIPCLVLSFNPIMPLLLLSPSSDSPWPSSMLT
jgi:hypothetical protein